MEIPGYRILETLGKGGMATVYLAIQESFERKVAIKVMSPQLAQDPSFGERFQREAKIVSQMNHPNIVTVYDVGVVSNHHYLAMEYVEGKELRDRFRDMHLMERIRAVKEIASALNYAGNKGYVHRDVKPENVMICDEDGRAVLMDFGIAKTTDTNHSMTKTGMAIGTPYYMSPEQAQGKPVDKRSDIYSLGVMFFQLLTGRVPYDAESQVAIGIKHITEPVPFLPNHLRMFQPVINKVMAKDPNHRYQTGAELIKDLEKVSIDDINEVDRIVMQEIAASVKTDPHAATVVASATAEPPMLNTGNVTTADAARLATRIGAASTPPPQNKNNQSPLIAVIVIVLLLAGGGWFLSQQNTEKNPAPLSAVTTENTTEPAGIVNANQPSQPPVTSAAATNETVVTQQESKHNDVNTPQPEQAKTQEVDIAAQAEQKKLQEAAAAKTAEQQKKQQQAQMLVQQKQQELIKAEQLKAEQTRVEQVKAEQARAQQIAERLKKADALREQGQLVAPEGNNAVMAYRAVLDFDAANPKATQALREIENSYLMGIRYQLDAGKVDEAADKLREAGKVFPNSAALADLQVLQQKKMAEIAAAKAEQTRPKISKLVVNDAAFDSMQLAQKNNLLMGRTAYVGFTYQNFEGATSLLQAVLYDGAHAVKIIQKPVVVTGAQGSVFFTLARPVEGFPDGSYSLDLQLNDQKLVTAEFSVKH